MKNLRTFLFTALPLVGLTGTAGANAFNVNEHDPRVTGRGGAMAASDDDASAIVFNPAGLALIDGTTISIGGSLYIAQGTYENSSTEKVATDTPPTPVPNLYFGTRLNDLLAVGIGVHFPYGLAVSYPDDHPQASVAQDSDLKTMFISPTVGLNLYKQVPGLSLGLGLDIIPASVELKRQLVFGDTKGTVDLAAKTTGFGFRAGVMYHPPAVKGLKLGVMYHSKDKLDFKGQGDFDIAEPYRSQLPPDGDVTTTINLPQTIWGGVAYSPVTNLEVEFDAVWINWKKTFGADPDRPGGTALIINLPDGMSTSNVPEDYKDTVSYRIGLDYAIPAQKMHVRAGFAYDPTPIPSSAQTAQLPDVDRVILTVGASRKMSPTLELHGSALWVTPRERDSSSDPADPIFHGTYGVQALVLSVGLTGTFGAKRGDAAMPAKEPSVAKK